MLGSIIAYNFQFCYISIFIWDEAILHRRSSFYRNEIKKMKHGIFLTNAFLYRQSFKDSYRSTYFSAFSKISIDPLSFVVSFCAKGSFQRKKQGNDDPKNRCKFPRLSYGAASPMPDRTRSSTTETTSTYPYYIMNDNEPSSNFSYIQYI